MIIINERLLSKVAHEFGVNTDLPVRLQKRHLLKALGFPQDVYFRTTQVNNPAEIKILLERFVALQRAFLILVDEKPMVSHISPMYFVRSTDDVMYRNHDGSRQQIVWKEMNNFAARHDQSTWLSFVPVPWNEHSLAARLVYQGKQDQVLEMQRGTLPSAMMTDHSLPCFVGKISCLDVGRFEYLLIQGRMRALSYAVLPYGMVRTVCNHISLYKRGLDVLASIASLPTLEFAFQEDVGIIFIDVDWPAQWVERRD
ncbi:hypothetical protein C4544_05420 [candidate division WS5 bacterium]|uniref:Uncharacterized protein n=1 Tax=candidate division WS5 bacterium TaxID=2093353 RepID=A0A419DB06_9BACT|nr:MAG: hypothetical protein C4544_05420 [candidate division WS5 bacterium]